jgi:hypothetical protein
MKYEDEMSDKEHSKDITVQHRTFVQVQSSSLEIGMDTFTDDIESKMG